MVKTMARTKNFIQDKRILIISEDLKSFPAYFKRMLLEEFRFQYDKKGKVFIKVRPEFKDRIIVDIKFVGSSNCLKIVQHANSESKNFFKIYCVFDELKNQNDSSYKKSLDLESKSNVSKIVSVPSYEFWLLLHFSRSDAGFNNNDELIKKLEGLIRKEIGKKSFKYSKAEFSDELFDCTALKLPDAIKNAKEIEKSNIKTGSKGPSTKIYQLIEDFQNNF